MSDNPEWKKEDFDKAKSPETLPNEVLAAFPKTRGKQKSATKVAISIRLSPEVVEHYKSMGRGWQTRLDEDLKALISP